MKHANISFIFIMDNYYIYLFYVSYVAVAAPMATEVRYCNKEALLQFSFMIPKLAALIRQKVAIIRKVNERGLAATTIGFGRHSHVTYGK